MRNISKLTALLIFVGLLSPLSSVGDESVHLGSAVVSSDEIVRLLGTGAHKERGLRLRNENEDGSLGESITNIPASISMEVYFDFNSAALTDQALKQLAPVGEALRSDELSKLAFIMEGHTDASGDESYNLSLSEMRAEAVKLHFVHAYEIDPGRLSSVGRGEVNLLKPNNPFDSSNRRVRIIAQ